MSNLFDELQRDSVVIRKPDGRVAGPYKCCVQPTRIQIMQSAVDVTEGDTVDRELPDGRLESYRVLEAQFAKGLHTIPDSWMLHVRKEASLKPSGGRTTNITIANANAIQIGDYNVQQISSVLQALALAIEESSASIEQKKEAKSQLAEFLRHPAVSAVLGGSAGAIVRTILGG